MKLKDRAMKLMSEELLELNSKIVSDSRSTIRNIMEGVVDPLITFDENLNIESANSAFQKLFGYSESEILELNFQSILESDPDREHVLETITRLDTPDSTDNFTIEVKGVAKSSDLIDLELSISKIEIEGKKIFFVISRDISAKKE